MCIYKSHTINLCMCILYVCVYLCVYGIHTSTYIHTQMYTQKYSIYTHAHKYAHTTHAHMYRQICMHTHTYIYAHIQTHKHCQIATYTHTVNLHIGSHIVKMFYQLLQFRAPLRVGGNSASSATLDNLLSLILVRAFFHMPEEMEFDLLLLYSPTIPGNLPVSSPSMLSAYI